jgi:hypothetical protein
MVMVVCTCNSTIVLYSICCSKIENESNPVPLSEWDYFIIFIKITGDASWLWLWLCTFLLFCEWAYYSSTCWFILYLKILLDMHRIYREKGELIQNNVGIIFYYIILYSFCKYKVLFYLFFYVVWLEWFKKQAILFCDVCLFWKVPSSFFGSNDNEFYRMVNLFFYTTYKYSRCTLAKNHYHMGSASHLSLSLSLSLFFCGWRIYVAIEFY